MQTYILKRVLLFVPTLWLVTLLVFVILRIVPGDPALVSLAGSSGSGFFTEEQLQAERVKLGTDRPIAVQYGDWMWGMLHLDFGTSIHFGKPVIESLKDRFPVTLELTVMALLMAAVVAIPLGVVSAIKQDRLPDYISRAITTAGIAFPNFWIAVLLVYFLVNVFEWAPPLDYADVWENPTRNLEQLVLPALALSLTHMAFIARITRSSVLEVLREDYIRTARSKGLTESVVISRHTLRNAILPIITVGGYEFTRLIGGTVIVERIFTVPGVGNLLISAITRRDYPDIQGITIAITVIVLFVNLVIDLLYAWLEPRIRFT